VDGGGDVGAVRSRTEHRADLRARKTPTAAHDNKPVEAPK